MSRRPIAYVCVKRSVEVRHEAFVEGFSRVGFMPVEIPPQQEHVRPGDVLAIWNRMREYEPIADWFEKQGGTVLVAENGYMGRDERGAQYYALSRNAHNGAGVWVPGNAARFARLNIELKPWRTEGRHILICPNRGIGMMKFKPPGDWLERTQAALYRLTNRVVRVRPHPGHWKRLEEHPDVGLFKDLENAWACVIWSSSAGLRALVAGVPVIRCAPWWIAAGAAGTRLEEIENPPMPDRQPVFESLSGAQWTLEEIRSGVAFRTLLGIPEPVRQEEVAAVC